MDPEKLKSAYTRLQEIDSELTWRVRPRQGLARLTNEQLEQRVADIARHSLALKEVLQELILAVASAPRQRGPADP